MILSSYKTKKVILGDNLEDILKESLPKLENGDVVAITSKIVSITQGNVVKIGTIDKEKLIQQEAEKVFEVADFKGYLTLTNNIIMPWAGIDESNGNGYYILLPKNPMKEAEKVWNFLKKEYAVKYVGVIIIDSTFIPLRTGSVSVGLGWCGFKPVTSYIGSPDVFGESLKYTLTSVVDSLSVAAGMTMGEGNEQKPLVVAKDIPRIEFVDRPPTPEEKSAVHYPVEKDVFGPLIQAVEWKKGENKAKDNS